MDRALFASPHRRYNPLVGEWVLVSPDRTDRPWHGRRESPAHDEQTVHHDPDCYLCPGNERAGGERNPDYATTFVFTNDFPSLVPGPAEATWESTGLLRAEPQPGTCRVLCFHPRHDLTLAQMTVEQIRPVVEVWVDQVRELSRDFAWVQLFENRGSQMGASNPHPHGQLWATTRLPNAPAAEDRHQRAWLADHDTTLLTDYGAQEERSGERLIVTDEHWIAVVPFWAVWPFESLVLPRRPVRRLPELTDDERTSLASVLQRLLVRYDNLFEHPFPYSMGWHGAPGAGGDDTHWQLHAHFFPPLLRSATVRKFMVGYEMLGGPQRDVTPEAAAERLRALPAEHYLTRASA